MLDSCDLLTVELCLSVFFFRVLTQRRTMVSIKSMSVPPPPTVSPIRGHPHVGWNAVQRSVASWWYAGGPEAFAPGPADPEAGTRARQLRRRKSITHPNTLLTHGAPCSARDRARGRWSGGGPEVCVYLAGNPFEESARVWGICTIAHLLTVGLG